MQESFRCSRLPAAMIVVLCVAIMCEGSRECVLSDQVRNPTAVFVRLYSSSLCLGIATCAENCWSS